MFIIIIIIIIIIIMFAIFWCFSISYVRRFHNQCPCAHVHSLEGTFNAMRRKPNVH